MKRLLISIFFVFQCITQTIQQNFKEDKNTLYNIRIHIAYLLEKYETDKKQAPDFLNEVSVTAQELINALDKMQDQKTNGVMYSLHNIMNNIPLFKKAEKEADMEQEVSENIKNSLARMETITQKFLSLHIKDLSSH